MERPQRCHRCSKSIETKPYYATFGKKRFVVCSKCHYALYPKIYREREQRKKDKARAQVFSHYSGGTMRCKTCGFSDIRALTIDHIEGGGRKESLEVGGGGVVLYYSLRRRGYPAGYQVLCMNCQTIKKRENAEDRPRGKAYSNLKRPLQ